MDSADHILLDVIRFQSDVLHTLKAAENTTQKQKGAGYGLQNSDGKQETRD